jgi:hypothetical protein
MFPNFPALKDFLAFGKNHSKDPCSQLPLRTRNLSSQQNSTRWMAYSACIESRPGRLGALHPRRRVIAGPDQVGLHDGRRSIENLAVIA